MVPEAPDERSACMYCSVVYRRARSDVLAENKGRAASIVCTRKSFPSPQSGTAATVCHAQVSLLFSRHRLTQAETKIQEIQPGGGGINPRDHDPPSKLLYKRWLEVRRKQNEKKDDVLKYSTTPQRGRTPRMQGSFSWCTQARYF